jgi:hypothetical protein
MNKQKVAERVCYHLEKHPLEGMTLEVVEDEIEKENHWWNVPIYVSPEPPRLYKIHEVLNAVEIGLKHNENITVFTVPVFPEPDDSAEPEPPPKPRKKHGRFTKKKVAAIVREYLKDCHPGGVTIDVLDEDIYKSYYEWRVPIAPNIEPPNDLQYCEEIAHLKVDILEKEGLNVFLVSIYPDELQAKREANT